MLVSRIFSQLFTSLGRSSGASRVRALVAAADRAAGDPPAALAALEEAAALEPDNPRVHALIAEIHIHAGRFEAARDHLERATARGATVHDLTRLGNVYQHSGDLSRAEATYRRALKLDRASQLAHYNLAFLMRKQGRATLPTTIALETATNPFLRTEDPGVQTALGMEGADPVAVFTELRERKNKF